MELKVTIRHIVHMTYFCDNMTLFVCVSRPGGSPDHGAVRAPAAPALRPARHAPAPASRPAQAAAQIRGHLDIADTVLPLIAAVTE